MKRDPELTNFENDLLESIAQAKRGDYARVHTPAMITARRGRPVGSVASTNKARLSMRLEADTLDALRNGKRMANPALHCHHRGRQGWADIACE